MQKESMFTEAVRLAVVQCVCRDIRTKQVGFNQLHPLNETMNFNKLSVPNNESLFNIGCRSCHHFLLLLFCESQYSNSLHLRSSQLFTCFRNSVILWNPKLHQPSANVPIRKFYFKCVRISVERSRPSVHQPADIQSVIMRNFRLPPRSS